MPVSRGSAVRADRPRWRVATSLVLATAALALPVTSVAAPARDIREVQAQVSCVRQSGVRIPVSVSR